MKKNRRNIRSLFLFLFFIVPAVITAQELVVANASTTASAYKEEVGKRFTFLIPGGLSIWGNPWGTDIYTHDCSIMSAAIHAGIITREQGGIVTIEIMPGQNSYTGSTRNGITSQNYGQWNGSFKFIRESRNDLPADIIYASSETKLDSYRGSTGKRLKYYLAPGTTITGKVWGTGIYTDDSYLAAAAVHAGVITKEKGGIVTVEIKNGMPEYKGSEQNGIISENFGAWQGSYAFITNNISPVTKTPTAQTQPSVQSQISNESLPAGLTKDYVFVKLDDTSYNLGGFHINGDHMLIRYDELSGSLRKIYYQKADQPEGIYISFDEQQHPYLIETKNIIYRFYNFSGKTATLSVGEIGKDIRTYNNVAFDYTAPVPPIENNVYPRGGPSAYPFYNDRFEVDINFILKTTSLSLSVATCAVATTVSAGVAFFPCASLFISTIADGLPKTNRHKKQFEAINKLIGYAEKLNPVEFPKNRLLELLGLASKIVEKDQKVYDLCIKTKAFLDNRKRVNEFAEGWVTNRSTPQPVKTPATGDKTSNGNQIDKPDVSLPANFKNTSYWPIDINIKKHEEMQQRLSELGSKQFALSNWTDMFLNVGRNVHYILVEHQNDDDKLMQQTREKEKDGYRLVFLFFNAILMKVDGYDVPWEHKLIKVDGDCNKPEAKAKMMQLINSYASQGYEIISVECSDEFRIMIGKPVKSTSESKVIMENDKLLTEERISKLAKDGYLASQTTPVLTSFGSVLFTRSGEHSYTTKTVVLDEYTGGKTKTEDLVNSAKMIAQEANKYTADGYYINFVHAKDKKIYLYLYK
jgi:hypothetical protein